MTMRPARTFRDLFHVLLLAGISVSAMAAQPQGQGRASYKWVDENGVTHYGNFVPPEHSAAGRAQLNRQGVEVRSLPPQLSPEEAAKEKEIADRAARERQHDQFLLTTYTSVRDIEQLRDERLTLLDGQLTVTRASLDVVATRIGSLMARAQGFRPYSRNADARTVPDALAEEIVRALHERDLLRQGLAQKEREKSTMRETFQADIERYQQLMAARRERY